LYEEIEGQINAERARIHIEELHKERVLKKNVEYFTGHLTLTLTLTLNSKQINTNKIKIF